MLRQQQQQWQQQQTTTISRRNYSANNLGQIYSTLVVYGTSSHVIIPSCATHVKAAILAPGGGDSAWKLMGVCRWPLKIGPKKIEEKIEFAAKKIDFCKNW